MSEAPHRDASVRAAPQTGEIQVPEAPSPELERLREDGFVILTNVLPRAQVETIRSELEPHLGPFGRNPFEGERTQRVYASLARRPRPHPSSNILACSRWRCVLVEVLLAVGCASDQPASWRDAP